MLFLRVDANGIQIHCANVSGARHTRSLATAAKAHESIPCEHIPLFSKCFFIISHRSNIYQACANASPVVALRIIRKIAPEDGKEIFLRSILERVTNIDLNSQTEVPPLNFSTTSLPRLHGTKKYFEFRQSSSTAAHNHGDRIPSTLVFGHFSDKDRNIFEMTENIK